jgi:hypothetical protein
MNTTAPSRVRRARIVSLAAVLLGAVATPALADFQVRSPIVDYRELEFEMNGAVTRDGSDPARNGEESYTYAIGAAVTPFWLVELEGETGAGPGDPLHFDATTIENTFQLTERGEYWIDPGIFVEYSRPARQGDPQTVTFGPLAQMETIDLFDLPMLHTANVLFEKELGPFSTGRTGFAVAWQSRVQISPHFEPGIEYYADVDDLGHAGSFADQEHRIGPMFAGLYNFGPNGKIKYELGYLFGLSRSTEQGALRFKAEYEIAL